MKKNNSGWTLVIVTTLALILANLVSLKGFLRFDLTKDKKFTLSQASIDTVKGLKDTITVSAYFSDNLPPPYAQHARYVHDLLEEYLAASSGHFAFEFSDPITSETSEDKAKKKEIKRDIFGRLMRESTSIENELSELGLEPVEIRVIEGDQQQTKRAYMGIVIRFQEKYEVIPVVQNLSDLEKDMTSLMRKLSRTSEPKLGLIKDPLGPNIERISGELKKNLALEPVALSSDQEISDDLDALLVVGSAKNLGKDAAKKIDVFLNKGKSIAFLLDRYPIDPQTFQLKPMDYSDDIYELLASYGISVDSSLVADASCASLNVQENRNGFTFSLPIKYPFVPELTNLSFKSPITKGLTNLILPFVSPITLSEKPGFKTEILAQSSKVSWLEKAPLDINPRRNWGEAKIEPDGPHTLLIEGRGMLSKVENGSKKSPEARLVVMGSSAFMWDEFLSPANQILALNIVDWMIADSSLLEMRAREFADSPIDAELSDTAKKVIKYGNILGVPFLLVLYGLIRWRLRESRRQRLRRE